MFSKKEMFKLPNTLSFRLTLWYASTFIFILLVALGILYFMINTTLNHRMDDDLIEDVEEFRTLYQKGGYSELQHEIENEALTDDMSEEFIRLLDLKGNELFSSDLSHWSGMHTIESTLERAIASDPEPILETVQFPNQEAKTRIVYGLVTPDIMLQLGESLEEINEIMELLSLVFIPLFLIVIPIATFAGWKIARYSTKGIEKVSFAAAELQKGDFDYRVSIRSQTDEIQTLVDTFNSMAERIRNLITEMREMIDNIAHDLRSPLGRIRAFSESALSGSNSAEEYKSAAANTLEECDRLIQMINTTLDVAEADAGVANNKKECIDLSKVVEDACELFEPVAEEKNIKFSWEIMPSRQILGNKQNIQRMLSNLLDNAIKYTPPNGTVNVNLSNNDKEVQIIINDSGIGIPESDQSRVFERFFRCDNSRTNSGCGLGLSLAQAIAKAHNGNIELSSTPNKGSIFTVIIPKTSSL